MDSGRTMKQRGSLRVSFGRSRTTREGKILMTGKLGDTVDVKAGQEAARLSVINALAIVRQHAGSARN